MEAPALMNKGYSTMHQQRPLQSPTSMQSSNKQFGAGNHGHVASRPFHSSPPVVDHKRDSSAYDLGQGISHDGGSFVKLFVGHVPRNVTEDEIRPLFAEYGNVLEVSLFRDNKRIGQQHGCCFIKYATVEEADRAIRALHNQHTLPGGLGPLQVRFADGEREQLGTVEHKLFVGSLNKQATEKEIEEIFAPYGTVDDIYIMRDEQKHSRGCAFVKYPSREMAAAAINALNGIYVMRGCNQPLVVRFAEPKRPKVGDTRGSPAFGGPGFGTGMPRPFGSRPTLGLGGHMGGRGPPANWRPMGASNMRPPAPQLSNPYGSPSNPGGRVGAFGGPSSMGGPVSGSGSSVNGPTHGHMSSPMGGLGRMPPPSQQMSFNSSPAQRQTQSHGWSAPALQPHQMQQQLQPPMQQHQQQHLQQHPQPQQAYSQLQPQQSLQQYGQQLQTSQPVVQQQQPSFSQVPVSQQPSSLYSQFAVSQSPVQQAVAPMLHQAAPSLSLPAIQQHPQQQSQLQLQQQPALQLVHQQSHGLQPNFQSQQQPSLQQQQHVPQVQTATQSQQQPVPAQPQQQQAYYQVTSVQQSVQQQPWTFSVQPQAVGSTISVGPASVVPSTVTVAAVAAATAPITTQISSPVTCVWSEHTSPEGHKYYYNSVSGESKWEKPEELTVFEQQQQVKQVQQPRPHLQSQPQSQLQSQPQLQAQAQPQLQSQPQLQAQAQPQLQPQLQLQSQQQQQAQLPQSAMATNLGYGQLQAPNGTVTPQHQYVQQDWMWKARPAGT